MEKLKLTASCLPSSILSLVRPEFLIYLFQCLCSDRLEKIMLQSGISCDTGSPNAIFADEKAYSNGVFELNYVYIFVV